jgi:uncharacterized RDD family membrane protein YckC
LECRKCGAQVPEGAAFCSACGQSTTERASDSPQSGSSFQAAQGRPKSQISYAGFWLRAVAYVIDLLVLSLVSGIFILGPLLPRAGISADNPWALLNNGSRQVLAIELLMMMLQWCYWALLESSAWQATIRKKILGLYVTDLSGKRISFARASGRYFAMIISTLTIGIGYLMAGFTPKKQALHDMIAECLVLKKTSPLPYAKP